MRKIKKPKKAVAVIVLLAVICLTIAIGGMSIYGKKQIPATVLGTKLLPEISDF